MLAPATRAYASPIEYTVSAIASGTLNGAAYTNTLLTFTATGDTNGVISETLFGLQVDSNPVSVGFTVAGGGARTLTGLYTAISNTTEGIGGIVRGDPVDFGSRTLLALFNNAFNSYRLATAIGPLSGSEFTGNRFNTAFTSSAGDLVITSTSGTVTCTATTANAVPEPTTLAMAGIGLAVAGLASRRRDNAPAGAADLHPWGG